MTRSWLPLELAVGIALTAVAAAGLAALAIPASANAAAPANDDFANAAALSGLPVNATGTNVDATTESGEPEHTDVGGVVPSGHSVWWNWTAPSNGDVTVDTCAGGDLDTLVAVYTGNSVEALTPVARLSYQRYNCDSLGSDGAKVSFTAAAGQVYRIVVASVRFDGATGDVALALYESPQPANDDFENAAALTEDQSEFGFVKGTNAGASKETGEPNHAGDSGGRSVWWSWTAPRSGIVSFDACSSEVDTLLAVYTGDEVGALSEVASDVSETCDPSAVRFRARAGQTYHIAIDGVSGAIGELFLHKTPTPPNDDFENAAPLSGLSAEDFGVNSSATSEPGEPNHAGNAAGLSLWWRWTAPADGSVQIDTCGSFGFGARPDTVLAVYTGRAVGVLSEVASNDNAPAPCAPGSGVTFTATAGRTYQIAADGAPGSNAAGIIVLSLWENAAPPEPGDSTSPSAQITKGPKDKTKKKTATFEFGGTDARAIASFQCKLDAGAFAACTSPHTVKVKKGKHTFQVQAIDLAGNVGSPATDDWKVKKKDKK
jgi:hypothetical protein